MPDAIVVFTTFKDEPAALRAAHMLVEKRLAACCNVVNKARSIYSWEGRVHEDDEVLVMIKTRKDLFGALEAEIKAVHQYQTPEIIALPVVAGSEEYLRWVAQSTE